MTRLRVTFAASTAADLLVSVAAIADPEWRDTFAGAEDDVRLAGRALVGRAERLGRYAFVNLLGLVPETRPPHSIAALLDRLRRLPPETVHLALVGGRRRQLRALLPEPSLRDATARRDVRDALASGGTVLTAPRWLLAAPSDEVKDEVLAILGAWRDVRYPAAAERGLRTALDAEVGERRTESRGRSGVEVVAALAGGLTYDPPSTPRTVLLLPAPSARPIVVVVDDMATNVVAYPPPQPVNPRDRLLDLTRALGDETRLRVLELLKDGERTSTALADAVGAPRTTLLHHLAMLRAAGLLATSVGRNNATYYALRPGATDELHEALSSFFDTR